MNKPIGGRGKKAPYETTHVRIPVDLKAQVEKLVEDYRNNGLVESTEDNSQTSEKQSINYREFIDCMIEEFRNRGMVFDKNEDRKIRLTLAKNEDDAYLAAKDFVAGCRTKKDVARNLLSILFNTPTNDPRLD